MKKHLIIASAALLLGTFACKKNETTLPLQHQELEANTSVNEIKQKMYDLPAEVITEVVRNFKGINATHSTNTASLNIFKMELKTLEIRYTLACLLMTFGKTWKAYSIKHKLKFVFQDHLHKLLNNSFR